MSASYDARRLWLLPLFPTKPSLNPGRIQVCPLESRHKLERVARARSSRQLVIADESMFPNQYRPSCCDHKVDPPASSLPQILLLVLRSDSIGTQVWFRRRRKYFAFLRVRAVTARIVK